MVLYYYVAPCYQMSSRTPYSDVSDAVPGFSVKFHGENAASNQSLIILSARSFITSLKSFCKQLRRWRLCRTAYRSMSARGNPSASTSEPLTPAGGSPFGPALVRSSTNISISSSIAVRFFASAASSDDAICFGTGQHAGMHACMCETASYTYSIVEFYEYHQNIQSIGARTSKPYASAVVVIQHGGSCATCCPSSHVHLTS